MEQKKKSLYEPGIETRFGDCKYKEFGVDGDENTNSPINKTNYNGWKAYLTFRF